MEDIFDKLQAITGNPKYSNSEVITPKSIVSDMVDLLPADVFSPKSKFLDPAVKSNTVKIRKFVSKKAPPSISEEVDGGALLISIASCCTYFTGRTMTCPS